MAARCNTRFIAPWLAQRCESAGWGARGFESGWGTNRRCQDNLSYNSRYSFRLQRVTFNESFVTEVNAQVAIDIRKAAKAGRSQGNKVEILCVMENQEAISVLAHVEAVRQLLVVHFDKHRALLHKM